MNCIIVHSMMMSWIFTLSDNLTFRPYNTLFCISFTLFIFLWWNNCCSWCWRLLLSNNFIWWIIYVMRTFSLFDPIIVYLRFRFLSINKLCFLMISRTSHPTITWLLRTFRFNSWVLFIKLSFTLLRLLFGKLRLNIFIFSKVINKIDDFNLNLLGSCLLILN